MILPEFISNFRFFSGKNCPLFSFKSHSTVDIKKWTLGIVLYQLYELYGLQIRITPNQVYHNAKKSLSKADFDDITHNLNLK